jgi:WD40 repeat protein
LQHQNGVFAVAFSPDGKTVLTGSEGSTARLWRTDTGVPIGSAMQLQGSVGTVAFSPDGKRVLTGSRDHTARLWRADTGAPTGTLMRHQDSVSTVAFSPDGGAVLTESGQWLYSWNRQGDAITSAKFLGEGWTGGMHFLDTSGRRLKIALRDTGNSVVIRTIDVDHTDTRPIQGDPKSLLSEWSGKLALTFDEQGRIVPRYPTAQASPEPARTPPSGR